MTEAIVSRIPSMEEPSQQPKIEVLASDLWIKKENCFSPDPLYDQVKHYTTTIATDGDPADVYYPVLSNSTPDQLPIALVLQEAFVDKVDYANYAKKVASYGFVVVVPYVNVQDAPKALIAIEGANHYSITNTDNVALEPNRSTLDQATATGAIGRWSGLFLRAHLLGDRGAFDYVYNTGGDLDPNASVISRTPHS
jgi:hypothetical protein